jgi:hypothetical protein
VLPLKRGAPRSAVVRAVIFEGMRPVLVGAVAGVAAALALGRWSSTSSLTSCWSH